MLSGPVAAVDDPVEEPVDAEPPRSANGTADGDEQPINATSSGTSRRRSFIDLMVGPATPARHSMIPSIARLPAIELVLLATLGRDPSVEQEREGDEAEVQAELDGLGERT